MAAKSKTPLQGDMKTAAQQLLGLVRTLTNELQAAQPNEQTAVALERINLDSSLERDLGLDSLAQAELLTRTEQAFAVTLSEQLLSVIESPRDLLREVIRAQQAAKEAPATGVPRDSSKVFDLGTESDRLIRELRPDQAQRTPDQAQTLQEVLEWHAELHPERPHIHLYEDGTETVDNDITYGQLHYEASQVATMLLSLGIAAGHKVALMLPTGREYFICFFGVLLAKGVPVPVYPPARPSQIEDHLRRHAGILNNAQAKLLITVTAAKGVSFLLKSLVPGLQRVIAVEEFSAVRGGSGEASAKVTPTDVAPIRATAKSLDTAFLQYTSGSTGNPKGVVLSHANLLANMRAIGSVLQIDSRDIAISWLPLYHDMGLIGAWFIPLYYGVPLVIMSPLHFLARPERWLWAIHQFRGTLTGGPNFAYELCLRKIPDQALEGLDLSSWRFAFNGAEPVSPATLRGFEKRFAPFCFQASAMAPVYGLAEASVGLAFPPLNRGPLIDRVKRDELSLSGIAEPAAADDTYALEFVASGRPLPEHQIRVVDNAGREVPDRIEGRIEFRGPSATSGYYRSPEQTHSLFHGDWLDTGDRGYLAGGDIYITGRIKDMIIRAGRNLYPQELEQAVSLVPGVRKGCIAVFATQDANTGTEQLVVIAESREKSPEKQATIREKIQHVTVDLLGTPADKVIVAPPQSVPKTSSGKIRRAAARGLYERGQIGQGPSVVWLQLTRLALAGIKPRMSRLGRATLDIIYGVYAWLVVAVLAPLTFLLIVLSPANKAWPIVRFGVRALFFLTATPLTVRGLENIPAHQTVVLVANHTSYLDVLVLIAILPHNNCFIAKKEFERRLLTRWLFSRLKVEFVERFDLEKSVADARRISERASAGRPLVFFPEGTFRRMPGLRTFHMGAFVTATNNGLPVVPMSLKGARDKLRDKSWLPRRGGIELIVGNALSPQTADWSEAVRLRDAARAYCLYHCDEPDLAHD